ncbi:FadR family transcriptional regulator [Streptomyces sp. NA04227]|uniref:FadR/GntR family transcriptional regulator n=1 Tax=Streptomyces sp. NA04227 TaxID=2742136 RepID=UPI0015929F9A|nr:FadR/GntR family transcriptional regulator [Streptomyces sp. NA04227]QKW10374.1 FadR family transcriptional regulator [Streptomyces sp. NA04227]
MALTDDAIQKIKSMIMDGRLKPGDRLPREADLSVQLGISRGSLREAVRALSMMRILDVRRGDGTYVTSLTPDVLLESMGFVIDLHQDSSVLDLFEVRRALEPLAAEKAALLMTDEDARDLLTLAEAIGPGSEVDDVVANDLEFHHRIAQASGNTVLCSLVDGVASRTRRARIWRGVTQESAFEQTRREHHAIATAITRRQPSIAAAWSLAHVAGIEEWLRRGSDEEDLTDATEHGDRPVREA